MANRAEVAKVVGVRERENSESTEGDAEQWILYVEDASNDTGSGAGMILISHEGQITKVYTRLLKY